MIRHFSDKDSVQIRDEYDDSEVMDCVRKERKNDGLGEAKKPLVRI